MSANKKIYLYGSSAYLFLCMVLLIVGPSQKAYHENDISAPFWYFLTISGNLTPEIIIIVFLFGAVMFMNKNSGRRFVSSGLIVLVIGIASAGSGLVTSYFLKNAFHTSRPSHKIFLEDGFIPSGLDSFYMKNNLYRKSYITEHVDPKDAKLSGYYSHDVSIWMNEVGESFPSGHSLNSFLVGILFSYLLIIFLDKKYAWLAFMPLLWAVLVSLSRYFVGVHEKIDIIGGAFIGLALAFLIIRLNIIGRINSKFALPEHK